jgi:hypothetical protein
MKSTIESRVRVDERGALVFRDARLTPGEEVDIIVRPINVAANTASFLTTMRRVKIEAASDFSERFDDATLALR